VPDNEQLRRLLSLYSTQKLSHHFQSQRKTKDSMIQEIIETYTPEDIYNFAYTQHATTKHHLHLLSHETSRLAELSTDPLDLPALARSERTASQVSWFYLLEVEYEVVLREPLEVTTVTFPWPVFIRCTPNLLMLRFTILEPSMASRFDSGRIVKATKRLDEAALQATALRSLDLANVAPLDLNRGVKSLWVEGMIDAPKIQWKKARATTRQTMDGTYLVKRDDPDLYQELTDKPLFEALFSWTGGGNLSLEHFTVDATGGTLRFSTFSDLDTGAEYVVREILERN
jgi:hypothetical protein